MLNFFRRIRQALLSEGRLSTPSTPTGRYLLYALGEIFLVMIGILLALQVNNWNQKRQESNLINFYFEKLHEEVEQQIIGTENYITDFDGMSKNQIRTLEILASKNEEDLTELSQIIGSVATIWTREYSLETFEEFLQQGLLTKVKNEELKKLLEELKYRLIKIKNGDTYAEDQYNTLIEPYFAKNINYANNALPRYRDGLIPGGPQTDFNALIHSMELWNIATFKLETTNFQLNGLRKLLDTLVELKTTLEKELKQ